MSERAYLTFDVNEGNVREFAKNADLIQFDSFENFLEYAKKVGNDNLNEYSAYRGFQVIKLETPENWHRFTPNNDEEEIYQHCEEVHRDDLVISHPGSHPGGNYIWVNVVADVYTIRYFFTTDVDEGY